MTDEDYEWMNARMGPTETGNTIMMTGKDLDRVREIARQAGYRAGLEEVRNTFVDIQRKSMAVYACDLFGRWLDAKLKEQP